MQATIEGPTIQQGRLEAPPPTTNSRFAFTKDEVAGTSNVIIGQTLVTSKIAQVLFDTCATHSFISTSFARTLDRPQDVLGHRFTSELQLGEILVSTHWLRVVPMSISGRELHIDMISLDIKDYDVILGMDFLAKYGASIDCC